MHRVYIDHARDQSQLHQVLTSALDWIGWFNTVPQNARVFIKPNLTWKSHIPGVTVTPAFLQALVEVLVARTPNITIGESEGGQACFQVEEAFESHGLYALARRYGISVVNLTKGSHEMAVTKVGSEVVSVELPSLLLHEVDVFITVPVPKIHALTGVSMGFKNQWGCLGDKMRVTLHPQFARTIIAINKLLKPRFCIFDGTYFLDHTGPMIGKAVPMDMVIAGDDIGATSFTCCELMQIDPMTVPHFRIARKEGMFPEKLQSIHFNRAPSSFPRRQFRLRRSPINYIQLAAFHSRLLNRIFYDSLFADGLHEVLWFMRRQSLLRRFLYGKFGTGEANRGGRAV